MKANDLASWNADAAAHGTRAPPAGDAIARAASRTRDRCQAIVDATVAVVVDAVADLGGGDARGVGLGTRGRFGERRADRSSVIIPIVEADHQAVGVEPGAAARWKNDSGPQ